MKDYFKGFFATLGVIAAGVLIFMFVYFGLISLGLSLGGDGT